MPYIERKDGVIVGIYYGAVAGIAETFLDDMDPEVVAFLHPQPQQQIILKTVIIDRLYTAGLLGKARAYLDTLPLYTQERWNARNGVYVTDPDMLAVLRAIGADPAIILAP